jgi:hypothetical protein
MALRLPDERGLCSPWVLGGCDARERRAAWRLGPQLQLHARFFGGAGGSGGAFGYETPILSRRIPFAAEAQSDVAAASGSHVGEGASHCP